MRDSQLPQISALPYVRWVGHLPCRARIAPSLALSVIDKKKVLELPRTRKLGARYTVEFFGPDDRKAALGQVAKLGFKVLDRTPKGKVLIVEATGSEAARAPDLQSLSAVHGVRVIRERSVKRTSNDVAAGIMGTARSLASNGLGLSGKGEIVAVCDSGLDTGDPANIHPDFAGRVAWIKSYPIAPEFKHDVFNPGADDGPADVDDGHGTHVAGSVLGDGTASLAVPGITKPIRGLAFGAKLVFQAIEQEMKWKDPAVLEEDGRYALAGIPQDITALFSYAYRKRARIHSEDQPHERVVAGHGEELHCGGCLREPPAQLQWGSLWRLVAGRFPGESIPRRSHGG
jgi:serine protease AprX